MDTSSNLEDKKQSFGDTIVSVFSHTAPSRKKSMSVTQIEEEYRDIMIPSSEMSLKEFLSMGKEYLPVIDKIRSTEDKSARNKIKQEELPSATISATFSTRGKELTLAQKIKKYNSLMVLDFDNVGDVEETKSRISELPFVYYVGLSVSGRGVFAVVPIDCADFNQHKKYFEALEKELAEKDLEVDKSCKDVTRLRVLSYDLQPFFNENCIPFSIQEEEIVEEEDETEKDYLSSDPSLAQDRVDMYVRKWEEVQVPLDDYDDWRSIGMSLSSLGEKGKNYFDRISRFSPKYEKSEVEKKYNGFCKDTRSIGIGTFFYLCQSYGILPEDIPHYDCVPFPMQVLPSAIQIILKEAKNCLNFPIDFLAPSLLFTTAVACGNSVSIEVKKKWIDKPIFYVAIVGGRGTNKSSCLNFALEPLFHRDRKELEAYEKEEEEYKKELKAPAGEKDPDKEEPKFRQTIVSDFTLESLIQLHKANSRGLGVYVDELYGFLASFDRYRRGNDEQVWTQLFGGLPVLVNRRSSEPVNIQNPCISIIGTIQPELLKDFARKKVVNGFMDRWLFAFPDSVPYPEFSEEDISPEIVKSWGKIIRRIHNIEYKFESKILSFTEPAKKAYTDWFNQLSRQKNHSGDAFAGMSTKMERYCARFALLLEVLKFGCEDGDLDGISLESVKGAICLSYYFMGTALKAQKKFSYSPVNELNKMQKQIYNNLPIAFSTKEGIEVADESGMSERTFKNWLKTNYFRHVQHGSYEKRYR